jgi:hypothetical protein
MVIDSFSFQDLIMKGVPSGRNLRIFILDNEMLEFGKVAGIFYNDKVHLPTIKSSVEKYCAGLTESYKPRFVLVTLESFHFK